ncbi:hypothetical protein HOY82DRAFT_625995 [Tuber indicum]|nr:hypothetical protein HOY82DRAFT_625995 [Tuber indicum]
MANAVLRNRSPLSLRNRFSVQKRNEGFSFDNPQHLPQGWKSLNLITVTDVKAIDDTDNSPPMFEATDIAALISECETWLIGTSVGIVHVINSAFKVVRSFPTSDNDYEHVGSI